MNIAFEISPLITASGTFGDKSGVYRYMYGLLKGMAEHIKKNKLDIKIYLFSFNPQFLRTPINPEIYNIIDKKRVILLRRDPPFKEKKNILSLFIKKVLQIKPNLFFRVLNRILFIKYFLGYISERLEFNTYIEVLDYEFTKRRIKLIFHSETAFYPVGDYKNICIMYDLTPINLPEFHRKETIDLKKRKLNFALNYGNGIICISKSTKDDLIKYSPAFKDKKIIIGYPGLDAYFKEVANQKFNIKNSMKDLNLLLKKYSNSISEEKYLLYYGTFEPRKNILFLVKAFMDLHKENQIPNDFKLVLIGGEGWGKIKKSIKNYLNEEYPLVDERKVVVLDYVNDEYLTKFIKNAYAVVYPSIYEGFGLPVLESMALKTTVISSNTSSLPEVGGHSVLYTNPWDFFDIKEKIRYLIRHKRFAKELSKDGLIQASQFTWEDTINKVMRFVKTL